MFIDNHLKGRKSYPIKSFNGNNKVSQNNLFLESDLYRNFQIKTINSSNNNNNNNNKNNNSSDDENSAVATLKNNLSQFLNNTTLHGLKYTGNKEISLFERAFFFVSFLTVFILSAYFISNVYAKWSATPIIIGTSPTPTYISTIPYPAVTICNLNQAKKSRVQHVKPGTLDYSLLQTLCGGEVQISNNTIEKGRWSYFRQFLLNVSQPCDELLVSCSFGSEEEDCSKIFKPVLSDEGLCCSFNTVHPSFMFLTYSDTDKFSDDNVDAIPVNWTPETGYADNLPWRFYPRKPAGAGSNMGLSIVLNASANEYYCSSTSSVGFKILLHNPTETPKIANYGFLMSTGRESRVLITPTIANASPSLRRISKKARHCLFANEGNLTFYRTYSKKNCELECESRLLEQECGCVLYYMPRTSPEAVICGLKDHMCTYRVQLEIGLSMNQSYSCDACLPACFELGYSPQLSSTAFVQTSNFLVREKLLQRVRAPSVVNDIALVHLYFASNAFRSDTKEELIGFTDFLSNTGGLLGLFMGFSVLSIVEIVYYLSLRPYCALRRSSKDLQAEKEKTETYMNFSNKFQMKGNVDNLKQNDHKMKERFRTYLLKTKSSLKKVIQFCTFRPTQTQFPYYE